MNWTWFALVLVYGALFLGMLVCVAKYVKSRRGRWVVLAWLCMYGLYWTTYVAHHYTGHSVLPW